MYSMQHAHTHVRTHSSKRKGQEQVSVSAAMTTSDPQGRPCSQILGAKKVKRPERKFTVATNQSMNKSPRSTPTYGEPQR